MMLSRFVLRGLPLAVALVGLGCPSRVVENERGSDAQAISAGRGFVALGLGVAHSCVLRESGAVFCWGSNEHGQVGDGSSRRASPVPVQVGGIADAVGLAVGSEHACALRREGAVACWGNNASGQLGRPSHRLEQSPTPLPIALDAPALELVACLGYTCARHVDGGVSCWGAMDIAEPTGGTLYVNEQPKRVPGIKGATLACGGSIACARRTDGEALCWGAPQTTTVSEGSLPTDPLPPFAGRVVTTARIGDPAACSGGRCWSVELPAGLSINRRIGAPKETDPSRVGLSGASTLSVGESYGCAAGAGGLRCWGRSAPISGLHASLVAVGSSHACAVDRDHGLVCWGENTSEQLGLGLKWVPVTAELRGAPALASLSASPDGLFWIGVTPPGDVLWWGEMIIGYGSDFSGWCARDSLIVYGPGGTLRCRVSRATPVAFGRRAIQASAGRADPCLVFDTDVSCWAPGPRTRGAVSQWAWQSVKPRSAVEVAVGSVHTCARSADGAVSCWGDNAAGQLGDGTKKARQAPVAVVGLAPAAQIAVGNSYSCARDRNGAVWCWGSGEHGKLGDGSVAPHLRPTRVPGVEGAIDLAASDDTTCVARKDGRVLCWGESLSGGDDLLVATEALSVSAATQVSVGCSHACALTGSGAVQCWGRNETAQLGDGSIEPASGAVKVSDLPPARKIAVGCHRTCAETREGKVYCWGFRDFFSDFDGIGTPSSTSEPRPVVVPAGGW